LTCRNKELTAIAGRKYFEAGLFQSAETALKDSQRFNSLLI